MDLKTKAAAISVISNITLVIFKLAVGIITGSVSIISEAIHSGLDLGAALIALFSVRLSSLPPDEQHRYGHGKIENVSGTIEAVLIFVAAIWIIAEAVKKLVEKSSLEMIGYGLLVMAASAIVNWIISSYLYRVARQTRSIALEADALHLRTDVYTSLGVFVGLAAINLTGWQAIDPLVAIGVALLIIKASIGLTRVAFMPLLDTAIPESEENVVRKILEGYQQDRRLVGFHKLRTRQAGAERHIDVHVVLPGNQDLNQAHDLSEDIECQIRKQLDNTSVVIHMEPCCNDTERDCGSCPANPQSPEYLQPED